MRKFIYGVFIVFVVLFQVGISHATNITFGWDSYVDKADIADGGFSLWYGTVQTGPWVKIYTVNDVNATTYTLTSIETAGLTGGQYWFVLRAFRSAAAGGMESANSTPVQWVRPTTTTTSVMPTTTTTSVKPTTTTTSVLPTTTTTSIKPVAPVTNLTITTN